MMRNNTLLFLSFLFTSTLSFSQVIDETKAEAVTISQMADKFHFTSRPVDDSLSSFVFHEMLESLHDDQLYFLKDEIETLQQYKYEIDDELKGSEWSYFPELTKIFGIALERSKKITNELLETPVKFAESEMYVPVKYRKTQFYTDEADVKKAITLRFKYKVMTELVNQGIDQKTDDIKKLMKGEPEIRKKVADEDIASIDYFINDGENIPLRSLFLNTLCSYYDPHFSYFSKTQKKLFENELSSEDFRFGISLGTDESGHVIIDQLEPGGSAWKSNKLNKGDRILKLQWEDEDAIDVSEKSLEEVHEILQRDDKLILTFTVKKANGSKKTVKLKKEKVELKEELVKSYILTGEKKIGYISLPDFYSGWEGSSANGCANDVAKEILKLQKENIEGVILDLRNNGGGSLTEALNLAGIFVNEGPLAIIHLKGEKPATLKDENRGTIFNGPLLIMVNGQSASASELFAAALQDHNRALIVGQDTYGKATGQIVMSMDTSLTWQKIAQRDFGNADSYVKITTSKLYRINGKTAQKKGVIPDIHLPDIYEGLYSREKKYSQALESDSINKKTYYIPLPEFPEKKLNEAVSERILKDDLYQELLIYRDSAVQIIKENERGIILDPAVYMERSLRTERVFQKLSEPCVPAQSLYTVTNHAYEEQVLSIDSYYRELNQEVLKDLSGDVQLMEGFRILSDLINFTKK